MNCRICKKRRVCLVFEELINLADRLDDQWNYGQEGQISLEEWQAPVEDIGPQFCGGQFEEETK